MTQKEELSALEKVRKNTRYLATGLFCVLVVGAAFLFFGLFQFTANENLKDPTHFSDPNIKYSDMKNASFTWTRQEINSEEMTGIYLALFGGGLVAGVYVLALVFPSKKDFHKLGCKEIQEYGNIKYCPECGLKLSQLKEKKSRW